MLGPLVFTSLDEAPGRQHRTLSNQARPSRQSPRELPLIVALALLVAGSVLAIGGIHLPSLVAVALVTTGATTLALRARSTLPLPWPALALSALAAYTLLQAVPIPMGWLEWAAPTNADIWSRALMPLGEPGPAWASVSLDPGATVTEALKWLVYAGAFFTAATLAARRGATLGVGLVFCSAIVTALVTIGHGLVGATKVWGLYAPSFAVAPWHVGPLLNPNTLAGYLNLGALSGAGLLLMRQPPVPRWLLGLGIATILGVATISASRGGVAVLPLGMLLLAATLLRARGVRSSAVARSLGLIAATVVGGALFAWLAGTAAIWSELYDKSLDKLGVLAWARPMIGAHPWLGIGRGAFESVFPAHELAMGRTVFTHAESFPAQWASEWGLPVALAFLAALASFLRPTRLGVLRRSYAAGAWTGVLILLLQNLMDLALEIPGICIAVAVVLGSLWGEARAGSRGAARRASARPSSRFTSVAVASMGGLAIVGTAFASYRLIDDRATILAAFQRAEALSPRAAREALEDPLRQMMRRHPAEPYFPLVGGLLAWRAKDQDAIPWIQRALERSRLNGRAHLLLAQVVAGRGGKSQALLELRFAMEQEPALAASAVPLALRWSRDEGELFGTVPEGAPGVPVLDAFARALQTADDRPLGERFDWAILAREPGHIDAHTRLAESLLRALPPRTADPCTACERAIEEHADAIARSEPSAPVATFLRIRLRLAAGRVTEAEQLLATVCTNAKHRAGCAATRAQLSAQIPTESALGSATRELIAASCATRAECARATTLAGQLHEGRGELGAARSFFTRAAAEEATEARWLDLARVASRAGAHWEAMQALERAAQRRGSPDPELSRRIQEERDKAMHGIVGP